MRAGATSIVRTVLATERTSPNRNITQTVLMVSDVSTPHPHSAVSLLPNTQKMGGARLRVLPCWNDAKVILGATYTWKTIVLAEVCEASTKFRHTHVRLLGYSRHKMRLANVFIN